MIYLVFLYGFVCVGHYILARYLYDGAYIGTSHFYRVALRRRFFFINFDSYKKDNSSWIPESG